MNTAEILTTLDRATVNHRLDADCRWIMREEACALRAAIQTLGDVGRATREAIRVAKNWSVIGFQDA